MADAGGDGLSAGWVAALSAFAALMGALAGFGGAVATGWFAFAGKDEELRVRLVEIAIGILEADPSKTDLTPARGWAMDIIDQKSGVQFSAADRAALLHQPIVTKGVWYNKSMGNISSAELEYLANVFKGFGENGDDSNKKR